MTTTMKTNGIDVNALVATVNAIKQDPDIARFQFRAQNRWQSGGHSITTVQGFYGAKQEDTSRTTAFKIEGDEPAVLLGTNKAPNAVELVLSALASCLAVGYVYNAAAQGINIESLEFDITGDLDLQGFLGLSESVRPGFIGIELRYRVKADAPREKLEELCDYVQRTSPMLDILRNPVPVNITLE